MTGFVDVVVVAMIAQLAVLPGEKGQFIVAGLSTRYDPLVVVAAAATAFAGWTALEIWLGATVQALLPGLYLDLLTAGLFVLFAVLLLRSAPPSADSQTARADGGTESDTRPAAATATVPETVDVRGREVSVPDRFGGFVPIFLLMAAGEFGDKTQLITITLAANYGATAAIWTGEMLAIVPVSLANAYFFATFSHRFDARKAHLAGAGLFAFFGLDTLLAIATGVSVWETVVAGLTDAALALV